jgi:transcriptional antiterminator RfaH
MMHWYALYTKPRQEHQVETTLRGQGIEAYLPTVQRKVKRRDRPDRMVYFPCYMFARLDLTVVPRSSIDWMPGVRRIVGIGDQPAVVADEIVNVIRERLETVEHSEYSHLKPGDRVRIISGPLRDLEAVFDKPMSSANRVRILLDVVGRMTPVDIDYTDIQSI